MTRILVSTNHREVFNDATSGWLYVVDVEERRILKKSAGVEAPYRAHDTNPRGGMRGIRGLGFQNGELALANYSSILFFDHRWNLLRVFTHPSIAAIHEIFYAADGVWVTSTANDVLARFDLDGKVDTLVYMRTQKELMRKLGGPLKQVVRPRDLAAGKKDFRIRTYFNLDVYDRVHLNSICQLSDGRFLMSLGLLVGDYFGFLMNVKTLMLKLKIWDFFLGLNRALRSLLRRDRQMLSELVVQPAKGKSAVVSLDAAGKWQTHLVLQTAHNPSHSVRMLSDGTAAYLNTSHGEVIHFRLDGTILSTTKISEKFLRGLLELPDGRLALGSSNHVLIFDLGTRAIVDRIELSSEPLNSVFDIQIMPPNFDLPPDSLEAGLGQIAGYNGQKVLWRQA
ncbi:MAG: hypothetical protein ACOY0R_17700 [Chloroflexota bacterium]